MQYLTFQPFCVVCDEATVVFIDKGERYLTIHEECWKRIHEHGSNLIQAIDTIKGTEEASS